MKTSSPWYQYLLMLFCITGIAASSCNQPAKSPVSVAPKALKKVDKQTLLNMVTDVAKAMSPKGSQRKDGVAVLKSYANTYDLMINGMPKHQPDTGYVYVNVTGDSIVTYFIFGLPQSLGKQITFADLNKAYGPGILSPLPKEVTKISTSFHLKEASGVSVFVDSKNLPDAKENLIEQITVMRLNP
jgi:hypothetical protein